jgi:hypothetical protein
MFFPDLVSWVASSVWVGRHASQGNKSLLLLFFRKEDLTFSAGLI